MVPSGARKSLLAGPLLEPHQLSSAEKAPPLLKKVRPLAAVEVLFPTRREYVTATLPLDRMAPPNEALLPVSELVLIVNGPLSTVIPPPPAAVAVLLVKDELLIL